MTYNLNHYRSCSTHVRNILFLPFFSIFPPLLVARSPWRKVLRPATSIPVSLVLPVLKQLMRMFLVANLLLLLLILHLMQPSWLRFIKINTHTLKQPNNLPKLSILALSSKTTSTALISSHYFSIFLFFHFVTLIGRTAKFFWNFLKWQNSHLYHPNT